MTAHLSPDDQLAALDGSLDAPKVTHLASCPPCEASVAEMRALVGGLRTDEVPEPSPLFWHHFAARVREATAAEPALYGRALGWRVWATLTSAATAFVLVLVVRNGSISPIESPVVVPPSNAVAAVPTVTVATPSPETAEGEPMTAMMLAASNLSPEDLSSVVTVASDVTPLVEDLSPAERAAFVRLLSAEMEKPQ